MEKLNNLLYSFFILLVASTSANAITVSDKELMEICVNTNIKSDSGMYFLDICVAIPISKQTYKIKDNLITTYSNIQLEMLLSKIGKQKAIHEFKKISNIKTAYYTKFNIHQALSPNP